MYLLGLDIGSSSIKIALVDSTSGKALGVVQSPDTEMVIIAHETGWAEQSPELWWEHVCKGIKNLWTKHEIKPQLIKAIGISYQMHGLVCIDKDHNVLRPSIIWCDSRAVEIGETAYKELGQDYCQRHLLNSPGNFTASKLKWVKENEPNLYDQIYKILLPGDFIAMKLTGQISTTVSGLSEGILWDFKKHAIAEKLLDHYGIDKSLIPNVTDTFSEQGRLTESAAKDCGLVSDIPVTYRAGDQPNNALSLNVFEPGEIAATGGTSGVVYGVSDEVICDDASRVNGFAHVNHSKQNPRIGQLLCINGAGIQYAWMRKMMGENGITYPEMEEGAMKIPIGSEGLVIIPFGNGAERMIENKNEGAQFSNVQFNIHTQEHFYRATLEGIAFSFVYGIKILEEIGTVSKTIKVGNDNLFQSQIFSETIATLLDCDLEMYDTTGAIGAAQASGVAIGIYKSPREAIQSIKPIRKYIPHKESKQASLDAYEGWFKYFEKLIS